MEHTESNMPSDRFELAAIGGHTPSLKWAHCEMSAVIGDVAHGCRTLSSSSASAAGDVVNRTRACTLSPAKVNFVSKQTQSHTHTHTYLCAPHVAKLQIVHRTGVQFTKPHIEHTHPQMTASKSCAQIHRNALFDCVRF